MILFDHIADQSTSIPSQLISIRSPIGMANSLIPVFILLGLAAVLGGIGLVVYKIVQEVSDLARAEMEKKNVTFSRDGITLGVQQLSDEDYKDLSQRWLEISNDHSQSRLTASTSSVLVKIWNHSSFPAYKSRLWKSTPTPGFNADSEKK